MDFAEKLRLNCFQMHAKEVDGLFWDTDDIALIKLDRPICSVKKI